MPRSVKGKFNFIAGGTYKFDTSNSTLVDSQFEFSVVDDGTHASGARYTTGVTYGDNSGRIADGTAGAFLQLVVENTIPDRLYDYNEDTKKKFRTVLREEFHRCLKN